MSDGTLRVLTLLIAVSQQPPPSLIVIEESEVTIHIHPGALDALLDALRIAGPSMQVVMTTHSPDILDAKWIEDQHIRIASWVAGISQIRPVSPAVRETLREHLMGAGELLRANALWPDEDVTIPGEFFLSNLGRRFNSLLRATAKYTHYLFFCATSLRPRKLGR